MRLGDEAGGAILVREIVQQPDGIADLIMAGFDRFVPIGVEPLQALAGESGAAVECGEFHVVLQDVGDAGEKSRMGEADAEDLALVDEVGEARGAGFLVDFESSLFLFDGEEFGEPVANGIDLRGIENAVQGKVTVLIEEIFFRLGERAVGDAERMQGAFGVVRGGHGWFDLIARYADLTAPTMQRMPKKLHKTPRPAATILSAGDYAAAKGVDFPPHHHSHWELVYYRSGALECLMAGKPSPGYPGLVWLTPPGVTHAERATSAYACHFVALNLGRAKAWPVFMDDDADRSLGRVCQQIVIEMRRPDRGRMLALLAQQMALLLDRLSSNRADSRAEQFVARAERVIEERCSQPLAIGDVAVAVHCSPSALRGYFQSLRGCSPREHLQQVRLGKAIGFLRTSTLKLEAVAELCGYDSASHLTRCVKKAMGKTPGQVRKRVN